MSGTAFSSVRAPPRPSALWPVFWRFAVERQATLIRRLAGAPPPWTADPILQRWRFTNAYRFTDRVSQHLIGEVIDGMEHAGPEELFTRILVFKVFNRVDTWRLILAEAGPPLAEASHLERIGEVLDAAMARGQPIFSPAYIMPTRRGTSGRKHRAWLGLIGEMLGDELPARLAEAPSLEAVVASLRAWPMIGPFLACQYAIDLNYSGLVDFDEDDFVVAGPGARDGLSKCFLPGPHSPEELIRWTTERQEQELHALGLDFAWLQGRRLKRIDIQNLFCEVSKYTRASHPQAQGLAARTRIKRRFQPLGPLPPLVSPRSWSLG